MANKKKKEVVNGKVKKKKLRNLTKREKVDIYSYIDWEGGLQGAVEHGGIFEMVEGTALEEPFRKLDEALQELSEAIDAENLEGAVFEMEMSDDE